MSKFSASRLSKSVLLSGASLLAIIISSPSQAATLAGMTNRTATQITNTMAPARPAGFGGGTTPSQAAQTTARSTANFSTALARIQAQMTLQASQRAGVAANSSNIPDGLAAGGVVAHTSTDSDNANGLVWENAKAPTQSIDGASTTVTVEQTAQKAILTWDSFNVGKNTTVHFDQSKGTQKDGSNEWVALNRINDPSLAPSKIEGMIKAEGSVYLINRNGILFSGTAQVNTQSLIASGLPFMQELTIAQANQRFLTNGIGDSTSSLPILGSRSESSRTGDVTIEAGADIETKEGGFAIIAGNNVTNAGNIVSNGGRTILAAGVGFQFPGATLIGVPSPVDGIYPDLGVVNTGSIVALRGDVSIMGMSVEQRGLVMATTSITRPGTISISAIPLNVGKTIGGAAVFGTGSLTAVLPDANGETTSSAPAADDVFVPGSIDVSSRGTWFQQDSTLYAPGGDVNLTVQPDFSNTLSHGMLLGRFQADKGAILSVAGLADIERPMSDNLVTIPRVGQNELADSPLQRDGILYKSPFVVDGRDSGTRDDGLQWVGSSVANVGGYTQAVTRTVNEMLVDGGSIAINGGSDNIGTNTLTLGGATMVLAPGAAIDVSGGYTQYLGGPVQTTRLIGADGRIYSAASADPMVQYVGFAGQTAVNHNRWGVTDSFNNVFMNGGHYESSYVEGGKGGSLSISMQQIVLAGALHADTIVGRYQIGSGKEPQRASLSIEGDGLRLSAAGTTYADLGEGFGAATVLATPDRLALAGNDIDNILFTANLSTKLINAGGFGSVSLNADKITVDADAALTVQPGGSISFTAARMDVLGKLTAHAGTISLTSTGITAGLSFSFPGNPPFPGAENGVSPVIAPPPGTTAPLSGDITIGGGAVLDVSGLWVNDFGAGLDQRIGDSFVNGGKIAIVTNAKTQNFQPKGAQSALFYDTTGSILLKPGSLLDASGGGYVDLLGKVETKNGIPVGRGGDIGLEIYKTISLYMGHLLGTQDGTGDPLTTGRLELGGTLKGYGFAGGGTLTLQALQLQIGGDAAGLPDYTTYFSQDWFSDQGFGGYKLSAVYDAAIADGATVRVSKRNYIADPADLVRLATGGDIESVATLGTLDPYHRQATDFSLSGNNYLNWDARPLNSGGLRGFLAPTLSGVAGTVTLGEGATILADAGADVSLAAYGQLNVLGNIVAHGGSVEIMGLLNAIFGYDFASRSVWLGKNSLIDVSGIALIDPLAAPVRTGGGVMQPVSGVVLDGGSVSIQGGNAFVVAEEGSRIDASGASAMLDIRAGSSNPFGPVAWLPTQVASDGGSIALGSSNGLYFDGTLRAAGGSAAARGGTLQIMSKPGDSLRGLAPPPPLPFASEILVQQSGALVTPDMTMGGTIEGGGISTIMHFAADRLNGSGIDTLVLGNEPTQPAFGTITIAFTGDVDLSLDRAVFLNARNYVGLNNATAAIEAPYVALAGGDSQDITPVLLAGNATLGITARQIDLMGQFTLQGFSEANFTSSGDIRLMMPAELGYMGASKAQRPGEVITAGDLTFKAGQIYPATGNVFLIAAPTEGSTITFLGNGSTPPPISAGGALLVDAAHIVQDGTIRAPSGTIQLGVGDINDESIKTAFNNLPLIHTASVTLGEGSLTSASLDGRSLPYGSTTDGKDWALVVGNSNGSKTTTDVLLGAPEKLIGLAGDNVDFARGATVDLSGGGSLYAQEFVPGTGGSRDLLNAVNTTYSSGAQAAQTPLYADGREVYAVVPGYQAPVAAYDPSFGNPGADLLSSVGKAVYLSSVSGLPDGVYTLLPGAYATLPGAFRVVQRTDIVDSISHDNASLADGSQVVSGRLVDALTGRQAARSTSFLVQSQDVWKQYSEYTITSADTFFSAKAQHAGAPASRTPVDAGRLALAAVNDLILGGTLKAKGGEIKDGDEGRGGAVDISAQAIQILGGSGQARDGYLQVDATALSNLGAESLLIGGTRSDTAAGTVIGAVATSVILSNDEGSALTGPEVMLVTKGGDSTGLLVESGSVIAAKGDIANISAAPILIGAKDGASGDGALVRVSNGGGVSVIRTNVTGLDGAEGVSTGLLDIRAGASILGGKSTILDATGDLLFDPGARFAGDVIDVNANTIAFLGDGSSATPTGFVVSKSLLAQLADVGTLGLHSRSAMTFYGDVTLTTKQSLILGAATFASDGGVVTISAPTMTLTNDVGGTAAFSGGAGTLTLQADELDFGAGQATVQGFGGINAVATQGIVGQGRGSFDFGDLDVTMTAPVFRADSGANTSLKTSGALTLNRGEGTAIDREMLGGALSLIGGSLTTDATITAAAGSIALTATVGDVALLDGALVSAKGFAKTFFDTQAYAPGGNLNLVASNGGISISEGATLDFSGSDKGGDAGGLTLRASGAVALAGALAGDAADGYRGGRLTLTSGSAVDLDRIADLSNENGITGGLSVTSGAGNLVLSADKTLKGQVIYLAANGGDRPGDSDGNVIVNGMIDVSGEAAGHIDLYGKSGVDLSGKLLAFSTVPEQDGGVVTIATAGVTDGTFDGQYGYETVQAADSGTLRIRAGALIDVSGDSTDAGGEVSLRAPLLADGDVKIAIDGSNANIKGASRVTIEPYAKWSTADTTTGAQHFDGIIDPAGWYGADGKLVPGQWTDDQGKLLDAPADDAALKTYLSKYYFTPSTANADHVGFYGYAGGDPANGPGALMGFTQAPGFSFGSRYAGISGLHIRPGIELANPGETVNGGNIDVLTNWNLGAGETGATGGVTLAYRYGSEAPVLTVRAEKNINLKASITDGFYQRNDGAHLQDPVIPPEEGDDPAYDAALASYQGSKAFLDGSDLWNGTINLVAGGTADISHDPNYEPLRAPLTGQSANYYNNYMAYIGEIGQGNGDSMWADLFWLQSVSGGFLNYAPSSSPFGDTLKSPAEFTTYADYANYYQNWLQAHFAGFGDPGTTQDLTPIPLQQPIDTDYGAYSQNYQGVYIPGHFNYFLYTFGSVGIPGTATQLFYAPFAPRSDAEAGGQVPDVFVPIAQPGPDNSPSNMAVAGRPASLASATLLGGESSSYRFVAGADFGAVDALALNRLTGAGSVTLDGHFEVLDSTKTDDIGNPLDSRKPGVGLTLMLPNVIRTGTGTIDIAAASDITLADTMAPGAIYTGGEPVGASSTSTAVAVIRPAVISANYGGRPTFLATPLVQPDNGGDITLTAGGTIRGNQQVFDIDGSATGSEGARLAQTWVEWLNSGNATDTATTINFANFDQGVLSAGGDVSIQAGGDIRELAVSLPRTWYLTGDGLRETQTVNMVGGGNLSVEAGGDILSGTYFVAHGTGRIDAGGSIGPAFTGQVLGQPERASPVSTILAIQDAQFQVTARGDLDIGRVVNPGQMLVGQRGQAYPFLNTLDQITSASSLQITSVIGDVRFNTLSEAGAFSTFLNAGGLTVLPATLKVNALDGGIAIEDGGLLYPSATGQLSLLADDTIRMAYAAGTHVRTFGMSDTKESSFSSILNPLQPFDLIPDPTANPSISFGFTDGLLHDDDADPVRIYSLTGDIAFGIPFSEDQSGRSVQVSQLWLQTPKATQIRAGRDIVDLLFLGQNLHDSDVTSIVAGRDIVDLAGTSFFGETRTGLIQLAGPGRLDIQAGRDLGPLDGNVNDKGLLPSTGIQTVGNLYNPYLPRESADISVLFGTGPGVGWDAFAAAYLDPAAQTGLPSFDADLIAAVAAYQADKDKQAGGTGRLLSADEAWVAFQAMPEAQRSALIQQTFFKILAITSADEENPESPNFGKYARGYQAIETLFPSALGYTKNNLEGGENGAATQITTGNLDIRGSTIQTQMGGNIDIMGPGGQLLIGSTSSPPYVPGGIGPQSQGILAWEKGAVNIFADQSVLLAQSRIFTQLGGDMTIWSSNGDVNAGKGNKTSSEIKPITLLCSADFYCRVNAASSVTGAGIAAFPAAPGDPDPIVTLAAPRGTVDAGDAGIRVSGDLIVAAQHVANADNIQVEGKAIGLPPKPVTNLTLTTASTAATEAAAITQSLAQQQPATQVDVEVIGYGQGDFGNPQECRATGANDCGPGR